MDPVRFSISRPVTVAVGVILVVMFGLIGLGAIPVQLSPNVDPPEIKVTTNWPGRSPEEMVDEITREQEEELKNVENLKSMRSVSREGQVEITLEFYITTDIDRALQEVSDSLRQVAAYPDDVDEPAITAATGASENAIAWMIIDVDPRFAHLHPDFDITTLYDALDDEVKPYLERIDGVAEINIYGGREREMRVMVDNLRLAQRGITHVQLINALRAENENVSAGTIAEGKRDYRVRVLGQFASERDLLETIVAYDEGGPVYVKDVASVELGHVKSRGFVRSFGQPAIAMNCIRQANANVMDIMSELRDRLDDIRADILPNLAGDVGPNLRLRHVYDETIYIDSAIRLVTQNLWVGGAIATVVLLLFLRSFIATGVIALAIPISVVGAFLVLLALGRTLNVISLAGLAFAVGMVVDNAIVVLENIFRHRQMGKPPLDAAYQGAKEVWGAILASTLTTVAVFIPVLTVQEEAGQLFRDISLAIVASVTLSLVVSTTVIPSACSRWLTHVGEKHDRGIRHQLENLFGLAPLLGKLSGSLGRLLYWLMTEWRAWTLRPLVIVSLIAVSLVGAWRLAPPLDYLPAGNRNLVFGGLLIPPGYSVGQMTQIANRIEDQLKPYADASLDDSITPTLQPITRPPFTDPLTGERVQPEPFVGIPVDNFFIGAFNGGMFVGATSAVPQVVTPVGQLLTNHMAATPDAYGGAAQSSLFGRGVTGGGNTIDVEISGPDLDKVKAAAAQIFFGLGSNPEYGFSRLRANPANFLLQQPELQVEVNELGRKLGVRTDAVGAAVRALFDGAYAGEYRVGGDTVDIRVLPAGGRLEFKEQIVDIPIATPRGPVVPVSSVVEVAEGLAPQEIQRIEELSAVTVSVRKPDDVPLEAVMADINNSYLGPLRESGAIDRTMRVRLEGTAAKLDEVRTQLIGGVAPETGAAPWQRAIQIVCGLLVLAAVGLAAFAGLRAASRKDARFVYAALAFIALGLIIPGLLLTFGNNPGLLTARLIWALAVTYLLMCALFESFVYPLVIMFTVPLAVVGGFAGLRIVHDATAANPIMATQNLDVLTMLGFVILIGVVVNNSILIVHQSLNLMCGKSDTGRNRPGHLPALSAIAEAVHSRVRPVTMSTLTSVGGMLPLILFPGAGSELYRGLGSVVVGGLLVSTVFTLFLTPLVFSIVVQMSEGLALLRSGKAGVPRPAPSPVIASAASTAETREDHNGAPLLDQPEPATVG